MLDVVKKEFKDHVGEMENLRNTTRERRNSTTRWTTFEDDENCHPNLFASRDYSLPVKQQNISPLVENHTYNYNNSSGSTNCFESNPFLQDYTKSSNGNELKPESAFFEDQNPFWSPRHGSSLMG